VSESSEKNLTRDVPLRLAVPNGELRPRARRWINPKVCDTWPVHRQTYGHLPSLRASSPFERYQVILLGDRGTQVYVTCPRPLRNGADTGLEPATDESQVECPTDSATMSLRAVKMGCKNVDFFSSFT